MDVSMFREAGIVDCHCVDRALSFSYLDSISGINVDAGSTEFPLSGKLYIVSNRIVLPEASISWESATLKDRLLALPHESGCDFLLRENLLKCMLYSIRFKSDNSRVDCRRSLPIARDTSRSPAFAIVQLELGHERNEFHVARPPPRAAFVNETARGGGMAIKLEGIENGCTIGDTTDSFRLIRTITDRSVRAEEAA